MTIEQTIENMLNKPYTVQGDHHHRFICWSFCREIYALFGLKLKNLNFQRELKRVKTSTPRCIVLFQANTLWHSGVVWPDGLHFIHASTRNIFNPTLKDYIVRQDRLTIWPYKLIFEGYYAP